MLEQTPIEKRFIHLIHMPYGWYVYDVNRDRILKVGQDVYMYLEAEQHGDQAAMARLLPPVEKKIQTLKDNQFLSCSHPEEMCHPATDNLNTILSKNVEKITLQVTQQCNLRCKYCIYAETNHEGQRKHSINKMTWDVAKAALDFLAEHSYEERAVNVGFYGGEPMLNFTLVKKCINYAKDIFEGKKLTFSLTTNGTIFTPEIVDYLCKHKVSITISLDGPGEIHDKRRVFRDSDRSTFTKVMENFEWIKRDYPEFFDTISISTVLDPSEDYHCMDEFFKTLRVNGDRAMTVAASFADDTYSEEKNIFQDEFIPRMDYELFNVLLSLSGRFSSSKLSAIAKTQYLLLYDKFENKVAPSIIPPKSAPGGPCIAGKTRLFVDVFGNLLPCERVSETSECMRIGHIDSGFNLEKAKALINVAQFTSEECKHCFAFWYCSICARQCDNKGCLEAQTKRKNCANSKASVEGDLRSYIAILEIQKALQERNRKNVT